MKFCFAVLLTAILFSCNNNNEKVAPTSSNKIVEDTSANYFPVTNFLKGDVLEIKNHATPMRIIITNGKIDTTWVQADSMATAFQEFLEPRIDSANLKKYFREESFLDKTLGTFTFSYSHRANIAYDFPFINWDVMIDEESQKIKRIYLVKKIDATTTKQLTWQAEKWCKMVTISKNKVVKEEKIIWNFASE